MKISDVILPPFGGDFFELQLFTVISGGQNGADQSGLFAAQTLGIKTGGWAPNGWMTLDGPQERLLTKLGLQECDIPGYPARTALNVKYSEITLRFAKDFESSGERCTYNAIKKYKKPFIDFDVPGDLTKENVKKLADYLWLEGIQVINIAGNSEKTAPGIGTLVQSFLADTFIAIQTACKK